MKMDVTRDVVSDLWPLYRSGEASGETRGLVEAFLKADAPFATLLRESETLTVAARAVRLSPDAELRLLEEAQRRARFKLRIVAAAVGIGGVLLLTALAGALYLIAR